MQQVKRPLASRVRRSPSVQTVYITRRLLSTCQQQQVAALLLPDPVSGSSVFIARRLTVARCFDDGHSVAYSDVQVSFQVTETAWTGRQCYLLRNGGRYTRRDWNVGDVRSPPVHRYIAIWNLFALFTLGWCPVNFVVITLTVQELLCWQTDRYTDWKTNAKTDTILKKYHPGYAGGKIFKF